MWREVHLEDHKEELYITDRIIHDRRNSDPTRRKVSAVLEILNWVGVDST